MGCSSGKQAADAQEPVGKTVPEASQAEKPTSTKELETAKDQQQQDADKPCETDKSVEQNGAANREAQTLAMAQQPAGGADDAIATDKGPAARDDAQDDATQNQSLQLSEQTNARTGDRAAAAQHEIDEAAQPQQPVGGVDDAAATDTPAHEPSLLKSDADASDGATDIATQSQSPKPADQTEAPAGDSSVAHPGETDGVAQLNKQQAKDGSPPVTTSEPELEVEKQTGDTGGVRVTGDEDERAGGRICSIFC